MPMITVARRIIVSFIYSSPKIAASALNTIIRINGSRSIPMPRNIAPILTFPIAHNTTITAVKIPPVIVFSFFELIKFRPVTKSESGRNFLVICYIGTRPCP